MHLPNLNTSSRARNGAYVIKFIHAKVYYQDMFGHGLLDES